MHNSHPLFQHAIRIANQRKEQARGLEADLRKIEENKADVTARLQGANLSAERLNTFEVHDGKDLQCAQCWISNGVASLLKPVPSRNADDEYRCSTCGDEFTIPSGGAWRA